MINGAQHITDGHDEIHTCLYCCERTECVNEGIG